MVICPDTNRGSVALNTAIEQCTGEYVARLGHADELAEHALLYMAKAINDNPGAKILYSDDDCIDVAGLRHNPHMKPCWNPDLFLTHNYIARLAVIDTGLGADRRAAQ